MNQNADDAVPDIVVDFPGDAVLLVGLGQVGYVFGGAEEFRLGLLEFIPQTPFIIKLILIKQLLFRRLLQCIGQDGTNPQD